VRGAQARRYEVRGVGNDDESFCVNHDPARVAEMQQARSRGGRSNRVPPQLPARPPRFNLRTPGDFLAISEWLLEQFFHGQLGAEEVHAAVPIMTIALKALSLQVAERVEALGEAVSRPRTSETQFHTDPLSDDTMDDTTKEQPR